MLEKNKASSHKSAAFGNGIRLDLLMFDKGLVRSRAHASDLIKRGLVTVDGTVITKAGARIDPMSSISVSGEAICKISRGAEKLAAALEHFAFPVRGRTVLDVGASTGGFCQILLEAGASFVYAVDVGRGQLHESLRSDRRILNLEGTDIRALAPAALPQKPDAVVVDVSFISLLQVLPAALAFAGPGAWLVALIKPQFEVGRKGIGKGGVVKDAALRESAAQRIRCFLEAQAGWRVLGILPSPVKGRGGNQEYLIGACHEP